MLISIFMYSHKFNKSKIMNKQQLIVVIIFTTWFFFVNNSFHALIGVSRHQIVSPFVHFAPLTPLKKLRPSSAKPPRTDTARGSHWQASTACEPRTQGSLGMETRARCRPPLVGSKGWGGGTTTQLNWTQLQFTYRTLTWKFFVKFHQV